MVIDRKCYFLVLTKLKHVYYFPCDGHLFLLKLVEIPQWEHLFLMYFDNSSTIYLIFYSNFSPCPFPFRMVKVSLSGNMLYLQLLAMKGFNAIRYNCFISMTISVECLCGFSLYLEPIYPRGLNPKCSPDTIQPVILKVYQKLEYFQCCLILLLSHLYN